MPNLIDVSLRQAQAMLKSAGLKQGTISYKPDIAQNVVLEQLLAGNPIAANAKVPKGSGIDLVLGSGLIDSIDVVIPDLNGLTQNEAHNLLISASLNLGAVIYLGNIVDSSLAKVAKQVPVAGENTKGGQSVDLYLKQE
jgi:beta-lactam-binding protein with PASTA domain